MYKDIFSILCTLLVEYPVEVYDNILITVSEDEFSKVIPRHVFTESFVELNTNFEEHDSVT